METTTENQCEVHVNGQRLNRSRNTNTVEHRGQCKTEVAQRINQAKISFWRKATILRSNISMKTRIRIMMCYVLTTIEGRLEGKRGRSKRTWADDIRDWTGSKRYDQIKRAAERRNMEHLQPTAVDTTLNE